jgi:hypothetical protein
MHDCGVNDPGWSGRALQEDFAELGTSGLSSMYPVSDWSVSLADQFAVLQNAAFVQ